MICHCCGKITVGHGHCLFCGSQRAAAAVRPEIKIGWCDTCKKQYAPDKKFCPECGSRLSGHGETASAYAGGSDYGYGYGSQRSAAAAQTPVEQSPGAKGFVPRMIFGSLFLIPVIAVLIIMIVQHRVQGVFVILLAAFSSAAILFISTAVLGKEHKWADIVHIVFGGITCAFLIGIFALVGGSLGYNALKNDEENEKAKDPSDQDKKVQQTTPDGKDQPATPDKTEQQTDPYMDF